MSKYAFEMDVSPGSMPEKVMSRIRSGSRILEFGCAEGRMTEYMTETLRCRVSTVELDPDACQIAAAWAEKSFCGNLEENGWYEFYQGEAFDYLLFADVLEHLRTPEEVLSKAKNLLKEDGEILITIPNIAHHDVIANLINDHFTYTDIGLLDNTHVHFWGRQDLMKFAADCGLHLRVLDGVRVGMYCTEQAGGKRLDPALDAMLELRPNNTVYQYFLVLSKQEQPDSFEDRLCAPRQDWKAAFYWDVGDGYGQVCMSYSAPVVLDDGRCLFEDLAVPAHCVKVRFDPLEGSCCVVEDLCCTVDGVETVVQGINGQKIHSGFLFLTEDPQIEFPVSEGARRMSVCAVIRRLSAQEAADIRDAVDTNPALLALNQENLQMRQTEETLKATLTNKDQTIAWMAEEHKRYAEEREQVIRDLNETLGQFLEQKEQELLQLSRQHRQIAEEKEQTILQMEEAHRQIAEEKEQTILQLDEYLRQLEEEKSQLVLRLQDAENTANSLRQQNGALNQENQELAATFHSLENGYWALENAYNVIINSQTYRITEPIRRLLDAVKRTRAGRKLFRGLWYLKNVGLNGTAKKFLKFLKRKGNRFGISRSLLKKTLKSLKEDGLRLTLVKISTYRERQGDAQLPPAAVPACVAEIGSMGAFLKMCKENGGKVFDPTGILETVEKPVVLVSHELNLTGAPVALEYFALELKEMGLYPIMMAPHDDVLRKRICEEGIPVVTLPSVYSSHVVPAAAHLFDYIVICTNVGAPLIAKLSGALTPVLWWIHESRASYPPEAIARMPEYLESNIHVYCGGGYAERLLHEYRPEYESKQLLYYVTDRHNVPRREKTLQLKGSEGKTVFAIVGMQEYRKGQDVLVEAIRMLSPERLKESFFVFVGRECYPPMIEVIRGLIGDYPENVLYIPQLGREDLQDVYDRMDCLVCASRDDPMPIVVADALSNSKIVICSENTGFCQIFEQTGGGLLYRKDDPRELMGCLMYVLEHKGNMGFMEELGRMTFERYFSREQFSSNVAQAIYDLKNGDHSIEDFCNLFQYRKFGGEQRVFLQEQLCEFEKNGKRSILLFSHELSLTGAPAVLRDMAYVLRSQGNNVAFISPFDGPMRDALVSDGFPVILFENVYVPDNQREFLQFAKCFQLIVCNTVVTFRAIPYLGTINVPVVWWIHDSQESYNEGGFGNIMPKEIPANVRILCGGEYARRQLLTYYPQYSAEVFLYGTTDNAILCVEEPNGISVKKDGKFLFICVGTIENRKGQDVLVQAIRWLPEQVRENCKFLFIGKVLQENIWKDVESLLEEYPETVSYIPQVSPDALQWIYRYADSLICSSRDDPMPVVVTQMQALSKVVICSENTGSAALIKELGGGVVYGNDSPEELAEKICYVFSLEREQRMAICTNARKIYDHCFSVEVYEENVAKLVDEMCSDAYRIAHTGVSVVIPCYNAGPQGRELIQTLQSQQGIGKMEIVCVDSGSKDGTAEFCEKNGCKVIRISQSEFSHSYARNLGISKALGSVIVVMTQDAMPDSELWIKGMIAPIVSGQASAVSCRENSPESTDLYYRVASWNNIRWLGIQKGDRIGQYRSGMSLEELRINASLNDVACAFDRSVFRKFEYRFGYAEDLDLGIRLLKGGYCVKLLHDPTVIHGHSRNAFYYLKRGFVEARALKPILGVSQGSSSVQEVVNRLMPGYIAVHNTLGVLMSAESDSPLAFVKAFQTELKKQMETKPMKFQGDWTEEAGIEEFLQILASAAGEINMDDMTVAHSICYYTEAVLNRCLKENQWLRTDISRSMCDCIYKQMALVTGSVAAELGSDEIVFDIIQEYVKGV